MSVNYKPSPMRSSPFRRPEASASPSPLRHSTSAIHSTPTIASPPTVASSPVKTPTAFRISNSGTSATATPISPTGTGWAPRVRQRMEEARSSALGREGMMDDADMGSKLLSQWNSPSQLQPAQLRTLREAFQILDRDSDGTITRDDVTDMLSQLGLPSDPSNLLTFFPASSPQRQTLAAFLNGMATALSSLSPSTELLSAFSAFDIDDSGQVDLAELRDALLHTAPDPGERLITGTEIDSVLAGFSGRRAFGTGRGPSGGGAGGLIGRRGDVFKYREFVNFFMGSGGVAAEPELSKVSEG